MTKAGNGGIMNKLNYSRQRQAIKDYLTFSKDHPTADDVYMDVRQQFPNISLGTIYRNLKLLIDIGEVIKVSNTDGKDRFDGKTEPHNHFQCVECNKVTDLDFDMENIHKINQLAGDSFEGEITSSSTMFYGTCGDCT